MVTKEEGAERTENRGQNHTRKFIYSRKSGREEKKEKKKKKQQIVCSASHSSSMTYSNSRSGENNNITGICIRVAKHSIAWHSIA